MDLSPRGRLRGDRVRRTGCWAHGRHDSATGPGAKSETRPRGNAAWARGSHAHTDLGYAGRSPAGSTGRSREGDEARSPRPPNQLRRARRPRPTRRRIFDRPASPARRKPGGPVAPEPPPRTGSPGSAPTDPAPGTRVDPRTSYTSIGLSCCFSLSCRASSVAGG
jgi:hypothetical protein